MPLIQDDRLIFSLKIVSADEELSGLDVAKAQLQTKMAKVQKLDTGNKNLFDPINTLVNAYQVEFGKLDGNSRSAITEQDQIDSANKKLSNHFFPNDTTISVPSLVPFNNIWSKTKPFAMTYAIGKNYTEAYITIQKEEDIISTILGYITSAGSNSDIQNTSGQHCIDTGSCSNPTYLDEPTCLLNGGVWTPGPDLIEPFLTVQTLKTNIVSAANSLVSFLTTEVSSIVTNDSNVTRQTQNNAAISDINTVIIPALNTWLAYSDFNTSHGQTTCIGFNTYNSNLLAPTKLHSTQLTALQSALTARQSFISTRIPQLNANLGTISQDLNTGEINSSSGLYGQRYSFLLLRLDIFGGSLTELSGLQSAINAQNSIKSSISGSKNTYLGILPTSLLKAPGNGTATINLVNSSLFSPGDSVFITAEGQQELQRAIKSISGSLIVLNDAIPAKYRPSEKARLYKDLT